MNKATKFYEGMYKCSCGSYISKEIREKHEQTNTHKNCLVSQDKEAIDRFNKYNKSNKKYNKYIFQCICKGYYSGCDCGELNIPTYEEHIKNEQHIQYIKLINNNLNILK
jgi:hypothetical protein